VEKQSNLKTKLQMQKILLSYRTET